MRASAAAHADEQKTTASCPAGKTLGGVPGGLGQAGLLSSTLVQGQGGPAGGTPQTAWAIMRAAGHLRVTSGQAPEETQAGPWSRVAPLLPGCLLSSEGRIQRASSGSFLTSV